MIVDASAILTILLRESEEQLFVDLLTGHGNEALVSPVNYLEIALRVDRGETPELSAQVDPVLDQLNVSVAEISAQHGRLAREVFQRFGRANHLAKLNLGDCFAYALAKARGEPLLFKGDDFRRTDIEAVL